MRLEVQVKGTSWDDLQYGQYKIIVFQSGEKSGLVYKCQGCGKPVFISVKCDDKPGWKINFDTLTATPSIIHDRQKGGCGWHGHLTNGELKGQIE